MISSNHSILFLPFLAMILSKGNILNFKDTSIQSLSDLHNICLILIFSDHSAKRLSKFCLVDWNISYNIEKIRLFVEYW